MSEHTPLPWKTDHVHVFADKKKVCTLKNNSEDGAYIVRSCNNFPKLIKELEAAARWLELHADRLESWANESQRYGWSTHQVDANRLEAHQARLAAGMARGTVREAQL